MKSKKILALLMLCLALSVLLVACDTFAGIGGEHNFENWQIVKAPTENSLGRYQATCSCGCGITREVSIPTLSNTNVWSMETVDATHNSAGAIVYKSDDYGSFSIEIPQIPHSFGEWEVTEATLEGSNVTISRFCECGAVENDTVAPLSDDTVWTLVEDIAPGIHSEGVKVYTSIHGEARIVLDDVLHAWGNWNITLDPTDTTVGAATRSCECGETDTTDLPVLTDAVWTVKSEQPADHHNKGEKVYTSIYGDVTVVLNIVPHAWGNWSITLDPTDTTLGKATRSCECGDTDETTDVPVLTDAIWTVTETPATYNEAGKKEYTSEEFGTVTVTLSKLVAPYDGKTYSPINLDASEDTNCVIPPESAWRDTSLTLDAMGIGVGTAYPFRGYHVFEMVNPQTGEIRIVQYNFVDNSQYDDEMQLIGEPVYDVDYNSATAYTAFVDMQTGLIVRARSAGFDDIFLFSPFEFNMSTDAVKVSAWNGTAMALTYTYNGTAYNVFCNNNNVFFNVTFTDINGGAVKAEEAYNAPYVYVKDADGSVIASFGYDGTKQNVLDGFEGTYLADGATVTVSGFGTFVYGGTQNGRYTLAPAGANYTMDAYFVDSDDNAVSYFEVTIADGAMTVNEPKVTVHFDCGEYATEADAAVNKNIAYTLPVLTNATMTFKGWYEDSALTKPVGDTFVPTADVTLYAMWKPKVVVNLTGTLEGDPTVLYLGEGDDIFDFLPAYNINLAQMKKFDCWYIDANNNGEKDIDDIILADGASVSGEDTGVTLAANWIDLPPYYGQYYGVEIWGSTSGNSTKYSIMIDENGNITGTKNGKIIAYDPATQKVTWRQNGKTTDYYFYYDDVTGIVAGLYDNAAIGTDFYLFSRQLTSTNNKASATYGVTAPKTPGSASTGFYARFITVATKLGNATNIFLYDNRIYGNVTFTNVAGDAIAVGDIKSSKTVVVYDAEGNMIFALASESDNLSSTKTKVLDANFGTYTNGDDSIVLDGTGGISFAGKTGTYAVADQGFDVYVVENDVKTEYYVLTLNTTDKTYTISKPMVNVTLDPNGKDTVLTSFGDINKNIAVTLPTPENANFIFRYWYVQGDVNESALPTTYIPTENVVLVAKWEVKASITIVYNDTVTADLTVAYGVGDAVTVDTPVYPKHQFMGWYTTALFTEGTEWVSGTAIEGDFTVYAKWVDAPPFYNTYMPTRFTDTSVNGGTSYVYSYSSNVFSISPEGKTDTSVANPYSGVITISNYDPETGRFDMMAGTNVFYGYVDKDSGIIITNYINGKDMDQVVLCTPFETVSIPADRRLSSYWNSGKSRAIAYTYNDTTYSIFVHNNVVYFGVTFTDALGSPVAADACYNAQTLFVRDSDSNLIAKFGFDGTRLRELDGFEGTYANGGDSIVVTGYGEIAMEGKDGTYAPIGDGNFGVYLYDGNKNVVAYYVLTLNQAEMTYVANPIPLTVDFTSPFGPVETLNTTANVPAVLPTLTEAGYVFRGWYVEGDTTQTLVNSDAFVITENTVLVAKFDVIVTMTVVYGNTLDNDTFSYGAGDTVTMTPPPFTNGKAFDGWYQDALLTVSYKPGIITEDVTVYAAWKDAVAQYGTYKGVEFWGTGTGTCNISGSKTATVDVFGVVNAAQKGTITNYDPATGFFKLGNYVCIYDAANEILVLPYYARTTISTDLYLYVKNADSVTIVAANTSKWVGDDSVQYQLVQIDVNKNGTNSTVLILSDSVNVYYNVSIVGDATAGNFHSKTGVSIKDANGSILVSK